MDHSSDALRYQKREFWSQENLKHVPAHYRLKKSARLINRIAGTEERDLLDIGCGPATLMRLLRSNIHYHGIDIAIHDPAPNLKELDIVENQIKFGDQQFDLIIAQGLFEYLGNVQSQKFSEIALLLKDRGTFVVSYTNFDHRKRHIFWAYSNIQSFETFRQDLGRYFKIEKVFPASHNLTHGQPHRSLTKSLNMHVNINIPFVSPRLAVEYFFVCSPRDRRD